MASLNAEDYAEQIEALGQAIKSADAIVVGAGAGLSTSAGFIYSGERFKKYFSDFEQKYGFHDMYSGGFYPYRTFEEMWAYWSRYIMINRYMPAPKDTYVKLKQVLRGTNYFVITTNVDHQFQAAGFGKKKLFYTQGDYGLLQCSEPCHNKTYDNEDVVRQMYAQQEDMRIPSRLVPHCPVCGKPMSMNLRSDDTFVEDEGWHEAQQRYHTFLDEHQNGKVLYLELGVGMNTPAIIKYPFWRMTQRNPQATYANINYGQADTYEPIAGRSILINADIDAVLDKLLEA